VSEPLLSARNLAVELGGRRVVDGVDLDIREGETLGIVGESGCGKTTTARLLLRLLDPTAGSIRWRGRELVGLKRKELAPFRRETAMVFQDPYASLNPRKTVGAIIGAPLSIHADPPDRAARRRRVQELMEMVGLNPEHHNRMPHEFSGGERQRIGLARAIALRPRLLVADEPVSALDVSIQAQILNLLDDLRRELGLTLVLIAHDLAVVRHLCDRVAVMQEGRIVEAADADTLFTTPRHPHTRALLDAVPRLQRAGAQAG